MTSRIGPFELLERLGRGGMGDVFRARETETGRVVAIKVLRPEVQLLDVQRERFVREARALARLRSRHIVSVHTAGQDGTQLYYAMDHVEGESLADRLHREGPLSLDEAIRITRCMAEALTHAHAQGVLHRDIKPDNILIGEDGTPLLADFGLTKMLLGESQRLTATGVMAGTLGFSPPEQVRDAHNADQRADIYGLGATLYYMLTCHAPVQGPNMLAMVVNTTKGHITPPSQLRAEIDKHLEAVVMRMLARDPNDRYSSSAELTADLDSYSSGSVPAAAPARTRVERPWWLTWVLLAAALTLVVSLAARWRPEGPASAVVPQASASAAPSVDPELLLIRARAAFRDNAPADTLFAVLKAAREANQDPQVQAELRLITAHAAARRCETALGLQVTASAHPTHASEMRFLRAELLRQAGEFDASRDVLRALAAGQDRWALLASAELELMAHHGSGGARLSPALVKRIKAELPDDPYALRIRLSDAYHSDREGPPRRLERRARTQAVARGDAAMLLVLVDMRHDADPSVTDAILEQAEKLLARQRPVAWYSTLARNRSMRGDLKAAVELMERAQSITPRARDVLSLGLWLERLGRVEEALARWGKVYRAQGRQLLRVARELPLELRILRGAAAPIHSATTPLPDAVRARVTEEVAPLPSADRPPAIQLLEDCARGEGAARLLEGVARLRGPQGVRDRITALVHLSRDRFLDAETALDRAAAAGDDSIALRVLRCRLRLQAGDHRSARDELSVLAKQDPDGWAGRAALAFERLLVGDARGALAHAEAALAKARRPFAYAARALALEGARELARAEVVAKAGLKRCWYLDRYLAEISARLSAKLATAHADGGLGTAYDPARDERAFVRLDELMRLTRHPRLRLLAARRLFEIPPGPEYGWHEAARSWLAEARTEISRRGRPPRLDRRTREQLRRELKAVDGMRLVLEHAPRSQVHRMWRGLTNAELGLRFQQAYRARYGAFPPPVEER